MMNHPDKEKQKNQEEFLNNALMMKESFMQDFFALVMLHIDIIRLQLHEVRR
jgi:hypothetical protein